MCTKIINKFAKFYFEIEKININQLRKSGHLNEIFDSNKFSVVAENNENLYIYEAARSGKSAIIEKLCDKY